MNVKPATELSPIERENFLRTCLQELIANETTEGKVLVQLRKKILGMNQNDYASLVGLSRRTLSDIENDTGDQSLSVLNAAFKPFGLRLGLLPTHSHLLIEATQHLGDVSNSRKSIYFRR